MANADRPRGFKPANIWIPLAVARQHQIAASQTMAAGDACILNSSGQIQIALSTSGSLEGVMAIPVAAPTQGTACYVWDYPLMVFEGQCSGIASGRGLIQTTQASTASVDIEGTTGIMEINEDANAEDLIRLNGVGIDPISGATSVCDGSDTNTTFTFTIALHNANGNITA